MKRGYLALPLLLLPLVAFGGELVVSQYSLIDETFSKLPLSEVYDGSLDLSKWLDGIESKNPEIKPYIYVRKIASIEVKSRDFMNDFGTGEPFLIEARRKAAELGSNLLEYKSGVQNRNTERISSETFLAYRIQYGKTVLLPVDIYKLSTTEGWKIPKNRDIADLFQKTLGRPPTDEELNYFDGAIESKKTTVDELEDFLTIQPEYLERINQGHRIRLVLKGGKKVDGYFSRWDSSEKNIFVQPNSKSVEQPYPIDALKRVVLVN